MKNVLLVGLLLLLVGCNGNNVGNKPYVPGLEDVPLYHKNGNVYLVSVYCIAGVKYYSWGQGMSPVYNKTTLQVETCMVDK